MNAPFKLPKANETIVLCGCGARTVIQWYGDKDIPAQACLCSACKKPLNDSVCKALELASDSEILTWLIQQGPPGAAEHAGLNERTWEMATEEVDSDLYMNRLTSGDQVLVRRALRKAMKWPTQEKTQS